VRKKAAGKGRIDWKGSGKRMAGVPDKRNLRSHAANDGYKCGREKRAATKTLTEEEGRIEGR